MTSGIRIRYLVECFMNQIVGIACGNGETGSTSLMEILGYREIPEARMLEDFPTPGKDEEGHDHEAEPAELHRSKTTYPAKVGFIFKRPESFAYIGEPYFDQPRPAGFHVLDPPIWQNGYYSEASRRTRSDAWSRRFRGECTAPDGSIHHSGDHPGRLLARG